MSRLIYACRFDLPGDVGIDSVIEAYKEWVEQHYTRKLSADQFTFNIEDGTCSVQLPSGHVLSSTKISAEDRDIHTISWSYPSEYDDKLIWRNDVRFGLFNDVIALEHTILTESIDFRVAPARVDTGSPRVIRRLCTEHTVHVGDMHVHAAPYDLTMEGVADFVTLLESSLRRLPIVFIAPFTTGRRNDIDATLLAEALAGIAVVVQANSADVTWEVADTIGRSLSCYDGAARIYWPGFSSDDEPRRHPLYLASRIDSVGPQAVARTIQRAVFSVAAFRFVPDPRITAIIRAAENAQRIERLEERKADTGIDWEQYALELDQELTDAKVRVNELESENESLKINQQVIFAGVADESQDEASSDQPKRSPTSNRQAVEFAQADCSNLVILESALEGADASPFRRPQDIYEALGDLNKVAEEWHKQKIATGSGGDLRQHLIHRGWGKRCSMSISDTTRRKFGSDYRFEYEGKRQYFEPHITIGSGDPNSCASIHFIPDTNKGKLIVAYVGRHLRNTKS